MLNPELGARGVNPSSLPASDDAYQLARQGQGLEYRGVADGTCTVPGEHAAIRATTLFSPCHLDTREPTSTRRRRAPP